ncbi:hypothetical protein P4O66_006873 [Electrophorus voltai]|uniref:Uncharacterized protein n=1 Tax=Electrophorus voltai TaxID=2609070 RepID=A0AAD8ZGA8_9TELE|nr:hypothetical protein P4O66_006873 [Electrophorus voltai]
MDRMADSGKSRGGGVCVMLGISNSANLKRAVPNLYQHVTFSTRGNRTLDHCYTTYKDSYKALAHPPFGKSDMPPSSS